MFKRMTIAAMLAAALGAAPAIADEAAVRKAAETFFGTKVDTVRKTPYLGLYEIGVGGELVYTDEKVTYILNGEIFEVKSRTNLTEVRQKELTQIKFSDLPLELAVKQVRGNGKRVFATFEDPNCGYCKKLAKDLLAMNDVTIYTFLYPILSPDSNEKSKAIWCSKDRAKAWNDWMVNGANPSAPSCDNPIDKVVELGKKLRIRGTPTIFFSDGERVPGAVPVARIEQKLASLAK
jgi:thiol:disulfide interchange protein DsbC